MSTAATLPIMIETDAQARIEELGMQREFEQMLEQAKAKVADLRALSVRLGHDYEEGGDPRVIIDAHRPDPGPEGYDQADLVWDAWLVQAFPPRVYDHFLLMSFFEPAYGR